MTASRIDLVHEALKNLGVLPEGQTPSAEDFAMVDGRVDGVLAELSGRNVVYVIDPNQINDEHLGPLGAILAFACAARYGQHDDAGLAARAVKAESDLYTIEAQPYDRRIGEGQYF